MKILSLYLPIYNWVADEFVKLLAEVEKNEDIEIWMNCPGGNVFAGWGIIGPLSDREGKTTCKVYGDASSMAFYSLLFMNYIEAIDVSNFTLHRADGYVESDEDKLFLSNVNKQLRAKLEQKMDLEAFSKITKGLTLDDVFDPSKRIDINLTAKDMKKLGLIDKIIQLDAKDKNTKAITERFVAFVDNSETSRGSEVTETTSRGSETNANSNSNNQKTEQKMNKSEFKAQHSDIYAEVLAEGQTQAINAERIRVKSYLAYLEVDKENVIKAIKEGTEFTTDVMAEMNVKLSAKATAGAIEADSAGKVTTQKADDKTAEQKELEAFASEVTEGVKKIKIY